MRDRQTAADAYDDELSRFAGRGQDNIVTKLTAELIRFNEGMAISRRTNESG